MDTTHEEALRRLHELVSIESPTSDVAASERMAEVITPWLAAAGAQVRYVDTDLGRSIVADVPGTIGDRPLLFIGHTDTVWPTGTLTSTVPWSVTDDVVRGPGAFDMKSGIVIMTQALQAVRDREHRAVRVVLVADEEIGSPSTTGLLTESARDVSAAIGFESPHPDGALKVGRRGSTRVQLDVAGRASHAALEPEKGVSAIDELVDQLLEVRRIVNNANKIQEVLCNVGKISGGARANVVPDAASAEIGWRFREPDSERAVLQALEGLSAIRSGAEVTTTILSSRPAWAASDADNTFLAQLRAIGATIGQEVSGRPAAGAGDTNTVGALGIPTVDGFGPRGGGAHAASEHLLLSSFAERVQLLEQVLVAGESEV